MSVKLYAIGAQHDNLDRGAPSREPLKTSSPLSFSSSVDVFHRAMPNRKGLPACQRSAYQLDTTELSTIFLPALTTHTNRTPEDVMWIDSTLDLEKACVVTAPEGSLPIRLVDVALAESQLGKLGELDQPYLIDIAPSIWRQLSKSGHVHVRQQAGLDDSGSLVQEWSFDRYRCTRQDSSVVVHNWCEGQSHRTQPTHLATLGGLSCCRQLALRCAIRVQIGGSGWRACRQV